MATDPIRVTPEELMEFWNVARRASDDSANEYAQGVYDTLQWVLGNGPQPELEDE